LANCKIALRQDCLTEADKAAGKLQTIQGWAIADALGCEQKRYRWSEMLKRWIGRPGLQACPDSMAPAERQLLGENWQGRAEAVGNESLPVDVRRQIWPALRRLGYRDFTSRLAFRYWEDAVDVVAIQAMDPVERKRYRYPATWIRVGIGVFWSSEKNGCSKQQNG
jgi:hypothetical protein